jgi:hypothetical protein
MENARKVSKRIRRICGKYLSVYGEHGKLGLFAGTKSSPNTRKVFKRIWRIRGKNLCVHGEDAKRLLAYSPYTPKDVKVCISRLIIIRIFNLFGFFLSTLQWVRKVYAARNVYAATLV